MDEKCADAAVSTGRQGHRAAVIMADVFLQMSLFLLLLTRSTRTERLIESSGLDRLSLGCAGNGCLWPIITLRLLTHHRHTYYNTVHNRTCFRQANMILYTYMVQYCGDTIVHGWNQMVIHNFIKIIY